MAWEKPWTQYLIDHRDTIFKAYGVTSLYQLFAQHHISPPDSNWPDGAKLDWAQSQWWWHFVESDLRSKGLIPASPPPPDPPTLTPAPPVPASIQPTLLSPAQSQSHPAAPAEEAATAPTQPNPAPTDESKQ